jgi:hypothetical protein
VIDNLNSEINRCLADPGIAARLSDLGGTALVARRRSLESRLPLESAKVVTLAGIKVD